MNLITLTDNKLAALHSQAANEIARRAKAAVNGHDAATIICGNEMAKRALLVAAAGNHSILFVGPPFCNKTMLRAVALELGLGNTFEARPCPCGYHGSPHRACDCSCTRSNGAGRLGRWPTSPSKWSNHPNGNSMADRERAWPK